MMSLAAGHSESGHDERLRRLGEAARTVTVTQDSDTSTESVTVTRTQDSDTSKFSLTVLVIIWPSDDGSGPEDSESGGLRVAGNLKRRVSNVASPCRDFTVTKTHD